MLILRYLINYKVNFPNSFRNEFGLANSVKFILIQFHHFLEEINQFLFDCIYVCLFRMVPLCQKKKKSTYAYLFCSRVLVIRN